MGEQKKRILSPNEVVLTALSGRPGLELELEKVLPDGTRGILPYRMQVLHADENMEALKAAQAYAKEQGELKEYGDIYKEAQVHEVLVRAVRQREKRERTDGTGYYPPVWLDAGQLRASNSEMEMAALLNAYEITRNELGVINGLEAHDAESWIARLSDPLQGPFHLSQLDSHHWPALCILLAKECARNYAELGRELPSLDPSSESEPETSTPYTGSSQTPPSASITGLEPPVVVPGDRLFTKEEAQEIMSRRKRGLGEPDPES